MSGPGPEHCKLEKVEEHNRTWQVCLDCGAQWDAENEEQVADGDGWCADNPPSD